MQSTQLAAVLIQHKQYQEAEALLSQLLLHVETVKVGMTLTSGTGANAALAA